MGSTPADLSRQRILSATPGDGDWITRQARHVRPELAERIPPDLWELHWALMTEPRQEIAAGIIYDLKDNLAWFPRYQAYLREHTPPTLILWEPQDGYMPEEAARAYLRDLPEAELHLLDAGHWLLETSLDEAVRLTRDFLKRVHPPA